MKSNTLRMLLAVGGLFLITVSFYTLKGYYGSGKVVKTVPAVSRRPTVPRDIRTLTSMSIFQAVEQKDEDAIKAIIASDKSKLNDVDASGKNVMHIIAKKGHYQYPPMDIPTVLIQGGINVNAVDKDGQTPLVIALLSGWQKIAMLLLDNGADRTFVTADVKNRITCPDCKRVVVKYGL